MPSRPRAPRFCVESLEDRVTPAVTTNFIDGTLTVTLGDIADSATVTGMTAAGTDIQVAGSGYTTTPFNGVTSLLVVGAGGNNTQSLTFDDAGIGFGIDLPGSITVNNIASVRIATANGDLRAESVGIADALSGIVLAAGVTTTGTAGQTYGSPVTVGDVGIDFITLTAGANGGVEFISTVNGFVDDTNNLIVNAGSVTKPTRFAGAVGGVNPLETLTTDAAGVTVLETSVATSGAQSYHDPVRVAGTTVPVPSVVFSSTTAGVEFLDTLDTADTAANPVGVVVSALGVTRFVGAVGAQSRLASLSTDVGGGTEIGANVSTTGPQTYGDAVTVTPAPGVTAVTLSNTPAQGAAILFGGAISGTSAIPFAARAAGNLTLGGSVTLSAAGSSFTAQAGTSGTGQVDTPNGDTTIRADNQSYRAGDGPAGSQTSAVVNLFNNAPQLRNAAGTAAPLSFIIRQDASITSATLPAATQLGGTFTRSIALVSDDGSLTLTTTSVAGPQTIDLLLAADGAVTVSTAVSAPTGTVRLRSVTGAVTQTAAGTITAAALGVRAATGIDLSTAPNAVTTVAAFSAAGNVGYATASAVTVGSVAGDPFTGLFTITSGIQTTGGTVAVAAAGTTALNLTVAAPLAGTSVTATGGTGTDRVTVSYILGATLANGFTFTGGDGTDTFALTDAGALAAHTYTVNDAVVRDAAPAINLPGVENLLVTGGDAADTFSVTPDAGYTVTVNGGGPTTGTGDTLTVNLAGVSSPTLSTTRTASGLQGTATFGDRQTVTFGGVESLTPTADVRVTATAATTIRSGESGTVTVTVINAGPTAVTGLPLTDVFPAGLSATWTASATAGSSVAATSGSGNINTTADIAVGGTVTFTIQLTAAGSARGTLTNTFTAGSSAAAFELDPTNNAAATTITTGATDIIGVGAGPGGGPVVVAYNPDGTERFRRFAFDQAYAGGVTVATGDINGDGFEDIVAGSAVGASRITAFDGRTGNELATFFAFPGFTGGVNVAVAGGKIVAGAGIGGGPVVALFTLTGNGIQEVNRFLAFGEGFRGGVQVGGSERFLAVGAGPGGGPHVKLFDANTLAQTASFFAFPVGSTDGVTVAVGGTSTAPTVIVGSGIGSTPVAVTFDATTITQVGSFQAFESTFRGGVRVAAGGIVNGKTTTVVAPGGGGSSRVRILASDLTPVRDFFAFESAFTGGVYVG